MNQLAEAQEIAGVAKTLASEDGDPKEIKRLEDLARDYAEHSKNLAPVGQRMFAKDRLIPIGLAMNRRPPISAS